MEKKLNANQEQKGPVISKVDRGTGIDFIPAGKQMSYAQMEDIANQLSNQSRALYQKLQNSNNENVYARLDFLFRVIDHDEVFSKHLKNEFVDKCMDEIILLLTIPEEKKSPEDGKKQ